MLLFDVKNLQFYQLSRLKLAFLAIKVDVFSGRFEDEKVLKVLDNLEFRYV